MCARRWLVFVLLGTALISGLALAKDSNWLATGTVVKVDGGTLYMLGKDNAVYKVDTAGAQMVSGDREIRAGTTVRVFGCLKEPKVVQAARVRVLGPGAAQAKAPGAGPQRDVRIVVEKEAPGAAVAQGPTEASSAANVEQPPEMNWQGKGLITEIDFGGHQVKMQTSNGPVTVNIDNAMMVRGTVRVGLARLNQGDTIWVSGNEVAPCVIDGRMIRVLRTVSEAQNAVPTLPVSVVGVILQIDYPSRTFKMTGRSTNAVVSVDDNTVIQFQDLKKCFGDLKPGTKINMSGYGNLNAGYAAQHIQIIAVSP